MFNWKKYISSKEQIIFQDVQSENYRIFFMKVWLIFVSLIYWPLILAFVKSFVPSVMLIVLGYVIFSIMIWVFGVYYRSVHFCLTDKGIYKISGVININIIFIPYKKITDTKLDLGIFERNLGVGSILINTAGGSNDAVATKPFFVYKNFAFGIPGKNSSPYEMEITHIKHYSEFMEVISKNI